MRRLGLTSRAAMRQEYRQLKAIHDWLDDAEEKYPAQIARVYVLEMLHAIPEHLDDLRTFKYCLEELAEALPRALRRRLSREEIAEIKEANEAEEARERAQTAKLTATWDAERDSIRFAEWIAGEVGSEEASEAA